MKTIEKLLQEYHSRESFVKHLRVGQFFVNFYIEEPWSDLYYEEDIVKAIDKINMWLIDNGYVHKMPKKTQELP
tara:strand:- start:71378 stop:71599 length:222 start_codon:yes stop_codon:yes gene_type:complete